jgi:hypothetical protein
MLPKGRVDRLAKLSAVIATLSEVLGMPESAVESYVKPLRRAGLITSGPRGTAAPDIPAKQMALCLIAILNGSPVHAVEKAIYYGNLQSNPHPGTEQLTFITNYDLVPGHTFLDMLTNLINFHGDGSYSERSIKATEQVIKEDGTYILEPEVMFAFLPGIITEINEVDADITFYVEAYKHPATNPYLTSSRRGDYTVHYYPAPFEEWRPGGRRKSEGDLERTYRISEKTIYRLGQLLKSAS